MSSGAPRRTGGALPLRRRLERLLSRSAVDKTIFLAGISLVVDLIWIPIFEWSLPKFADVDFIKPEVIREIADIFWIAAGALALVIVWGIYLRKRETNGEIYTAVFFVVYALLFSWLLHLMGTFSTPGLIIYMGLPPLVLMVYGRRAGAFSYVLATVCLLAVAFSEYFGFIPYAPVSTMDFTALYGQGPVFFVFLGTTIALTLIMFSLVWIRRQQLLDKEGELGQTLESLGATRERLVRAQQSAEVGQLAAAVALDLEQAVTDAATLAATLYEQIPQSRLDLSGRDLERFRDELGQAKAATERAAILLGTLDGPVREQTSAADLVNLNALVSDALSQVRRRRGEESFDVRIELAAEVPLVRANPGELLWALDRVLQHALGAQDEQSRAHITLSTRVDMRGATFGCAYRSAPDGSYSDEPLSPVHRTVARLGGRINLSSALDGSASIEIVLPLGT